MKTIKIFLASSAELKNERIAFGNLIRQLDDIYTRRGISIKLVVWEELNTSFDVNRPRTQDEYNKKVRQSDIFVAMFHTIAGRYTKEEVDVAMDENGKRQMPKLLIYCHELQPGEIESPEMRELKHRLGEELGYYWKNYSISDTMHLDFVMWLNRSEAIERDVLKVENGKVKFDGIPVAQMDRLPFAAGNTEYKEMQDKLVSLNNEIEQLQQAVKQIPSLRDLFQSKINERNSLKEKLEQYEISLLDTAKRIAEMQLESVSNSLHRAIVAFDQGNLERANAILDEIAHEADNHIERMEQDRTLVHQDIEAFLLQTKTLMADFTIPVAVRITNVAAIYAKADNWASRSAYDKKKYAQLLLDYAGFLDDYAFFNEAINIYQRQIVLSEELYGVNSKESALSYNNIGSVYSRLGDYAQALEYIGKSLNIREQILGVDNPDTAISYNSVGSVYWKQGNYTQALKYYFKALFIREKTLNISHSDTAMSYNNIGSIYWCQGNYKQALEYYLKALAIRKWVLGIDHRETAMSYNNIGLVYKSIGDYSNALDYYLKALAIDERVLGTNHPDTAIDYNNIGVVYNNKGEYSNALEYYFKALAINERVMGVDHPDVAVFYNNIGLVYKNQGDFSRALEFYQKALVINEQFLGLEHPNTKTIRANIAEVNAAMNKNMMN